MTEKKPTRPGESRVTYQEGSEVRRLDGKVTFIREQDVCFVRVKRDETIVLLNVSYVIKVESERDGGKRAQEGNDPTG